MKIATWNINGIKARIDLVPKWLAEAQPDVVCLQEIKSVDENFPATVFEDLGYNVVIELFRGISVPKGTPDSVVAQLEEAFKKGSQEPEFMEFAKQNSFNINFMGMDDFNAYVNPMDDKIAKVMEETGLKKN